MDFGGDGPEDPDWRVPISRARGERLSEALLDLDVECVIIEDPVELYWLTGGRQNGMLVIGAKDSESGRHGVESPFASEVGIRWI